MISGFKGLMIDKKGDLDQSATRRGRSEIRPETFTHQRGQSTKLKKNLQCEFKIPTWLPVGTMGAYHLHKLPGWKSYAQT